MIINPFLLAKEIDKQMSDIVEDPKDNYGKRVALYFVAFFGVIVLVNSFFMYMAVTTMPGVVVKNAYKKGLAYNETLEKARSQPILNQTVSYNNDSGALRWELIENGEPLTDAVVDARIYRLVQDDYDVDVSLNHIGAGIYETTLSLPLKGQWTARLRSKWDDKQYQIRHQLLVE